MTDINHLRQLRTPTKEAPLRILTSACLLGVRCGYDGTSYGRYPKVFDLQHSDKVRLFRFCPEDLAFGTPRDLCDIHGGNGFDVLDGQAKVLSEKGEDWTQPLLAAADRMLAVAQQNEVELCILMDISAACGSQVIYLGNRLQADSRYQKGPGVCAALLQRHGFPVISQRDFAALELVYTKIQPGYRPDPEAKDHHETEWYHGYFG